MLPFHEIKNRLNTPAENVFVGVGAYEGQKACFYGSPWVEEKGFKWTVQHSVHNSAAPFPPFYGCGNLQFFKDSDDH